MYAKLYLCVCDWFLSFLKDWWHCGGKSLVSFAHHSTRAAGSPYSCVRLFVTPWTVACQSALSMGFSRQEYWNGWPCPPPGDLPHPGIESGSPSLWADALLSEPPGKSQFYSWPLANDAPVANIFSAFLHLFTNRDTKCRWCTRDCGMAEEKSGSFLRERIFGLYFAGYIGCFLCNEEIE